MVAFVKPSRMRTRVHLRWGSPPRCLWPEESPREEIPFLIKKTKFKFNFCSFCHRTALVFLILIEISFHPFHPHSLWSSAIRCVGIVRQLSVVRPIVLAAQFVRRTIAHTVPQTERPIAGRLIQCLPRQQLPVQPSSAARLHCERDLISNRVRWFERRIHYFLSTQRR